MSRPFLPSNFVMQSHGRERVHIATGKASVGMVVAIDDGRGLAVALVADQGSRARATICVAELLPRRFYRVEGAMYPFHRTDAQGVAMLEVAVAGHAVLALWPVV